ncbi:helix-turn-helix domain-containing protein [Halovenus marina]|uniref:helix-turn-helix domain-containing protein n=1 Tax=Halovenus marina TaxID=3396621 RepID=UPI003F5606E6
MAQSESSAEGDSSGVGGQPLRARLAIEPHTDSDCAILDADGTSNEVTQQLKYPEFGPGQHSDSGTDCRECHSEVVLEGGDDLTAAYLTSDVTTHCICPVFAECDCISHITAVRDQKLIVDVTVRDRATLRELMRGLGAVDASVTVEWLVRGDSSTITTEIDTSSITDKQQTAIETAVEMGYYEQPRTTDLGAIADELGISESAVSQRLNNAETKLVEAYLHDDIV